ncbi:MULTISPECIES: ferredoxin [unclassified Anabaena]|uniref:(2Fe-2S) ferredoxin domain-containing protein n=1 Tax=unclassified Anabaena TaxID=2619674 RepID=UPI001444CB66|nr:MULTISPECIES: (2Fe-2S) ferredoxin domain-containing protein [unclassified Anabaena]MTJ10317.1 (2Fe-2S) ferredoxin domain-containing protein [Anabaena sp. UHCC 0204]MTJ54475.1 (2Fe-2S) ferredoxin domain-containing protein [Anabaena sp. UHCC 0253]
MDELISNIPTQVQSPPISVQVCQHRTCRKQGAKEVLAALQAFPIANTTVTVSGCLGQCGNGPMVLVLPEMVWYCRVQPQEIPRLVEQHLLGGKKVKKMLYYRFHPHG